jgi:hypothetical protein
MHNQMFEKDLQPEFKGGPNNMYDDKVQGLFREGLAQMREDKQIQKRPNFVDFKPSPISLINNQRPNSESNISVGFFNP